MNRADGFTLIEVLLSVTIIGMLVGISVPVYESFVRRNDLDLTAQVISATLRRAETYARAVNGDNAWSVEIQASTVTLFQGTSFASRNTAYDETLSIPNSITPSGLSEIQFAKFSAAPNATGSITLSSTTNSTRTITVNAKGTVDY
ncbi:MAG TPA: type II secretion system protein [Candidatus Saccharimonadales bacterium]|nr:type II secretion system protein [Candidatus Saccharimonadales bacterium]